MSGLELLSSVCKASSPKTSPSPVSTPIKSNPFSRSSPLTPPHSSSPPKRVKSEINSPSAYGHRYGKESAIEKARASGSLHKSPSSKKGASTTSNGETVYCLCRKPFANEDMIACDRCEDWFHPACVGITTEQLRKLTDSNGTYVCPLCENSELKNTLISCSRCKASDSLFNIGISKDRASRLKERDAYVCKKCLSSLPHCCNPGCDKPRRPNSSYCSASCCDSAAEVLLKRVMVDAPVLSEAEESELAELLAEEAELNEKVFAAQETFKELRLLVKRLQKSNNNDTLPKGSKDVVECPVCSKSFPAHTFLRHVHSCSIEDNSTSTCGAFIQETKSFCQLQISDCQKHEDLRMTSHRANNTLCGYPLKKFPSGKFDTASLCQKAWWLCEPHKGWEYIMVSEAHANLGQLAKTLHSVQSRKHRYERVKNSRRAHRLFSPSTPPSLPRPRSTIAAAPPSPMGPPTPTRGSPSRPSSTSAPASEPQQTVTRLFDDVISQHTPPSPAPSLTTTTLPSPKLSL